MARLLTLPGDMEWLSSALSPRLHPGSMPRSWRYHAVAGAKGKGTRELRTEVAVCGLDPAHGWDFDLFLDRYCARCLRALKLACSDCRGTRWISEAQGRQRKLPHGPCRKCGGTGVDIARVDTRPVSE